MDKTKDSVLDISLFAGPLIAISLYKSIGSMTSVFLIAVAPAVLAFFATTIWLRQRDEAEKR